MRLATVLSLLIVGQLVTAAVFSTRLDEDILPIARAKAESLAEQLIAESVSAVTGAEQFAGTVPVTVTYGEDGSITAIVTDASYLNTLRSALLTDLSRRLKKCSAIKLQMPVGSLFDSPITAGRGFPVSVRALIPAHASVTADSVMTDAGINQVLHRIQLCITVEMTLLLPFHSEELTVTQRIYAGETVVVGGVPWQG